MTHIEFIQQHNQLYTVSPGEADVVVACACSAPVLAATQILEGKPPPKITCVS
jgi:hypothetical protein